MNAAGVSVHSGNTVTSVQYRFGLDTLAIQLSNGDVVCCSFFINAILNWLLNVPDLDRHAIAIPAVSYLAQGLFYWIDN